MDTALSIVAIVAAIAAAVSAIAALIGVLLARKSLDAHWASEWANQRPVVYPLLSLDWLRGSGAYDVTPLGASGQPCWILIPLKNGGRGPALNVRLTIASATGKYSCDVGVGTIGVGDLLDARLAPPGIDDWSGAAGSLAYTDLVGGSYEMPFTVSGKSDQLEVAVGQVTHTPPQPTSPAS